jgi:hypothetical protein
MDLEVLKMGYIKQLIELVYYYRDDAKHGKPYWQDPAFLGLMVSLLATILAKYAGVNIDSDLQLKIVGAATGIGVALSPHTGLKKLSPPAPKPAETHDLGSLS